MRPVPHGGLGFEKLWRVFLILMILMDHSEAQEGGDIFCKRGFLQSIFFDNHKKGQKKDYPVVNDVSPTSFSPVPSVWAAFIIASYRAFFPARVSGSGTIPVSSIVSGNTRYR